MSLSSMHKWGSLSIVKLSKPLFSTLLHCSLFNFVRPGNDVLKCTAMTVLATGLYYKLLNYYLFLVSPLGIKYLAIADLC